MVICLERGADLHMAPLMPLPLTVSCFSKIQIAFTFLVLAYPGSPGKRADKRVCVCLLDLVSPVSTKDRPGKTSPKLLVVIVFYYCLFSTLCHKGKVQLHVNSSDSTN